MWQAGTVIIRREQAGDKIRVRQVISDAFRTGDGDPVEVELVEQLRRCANWIPELSLVALREGEVMGHVVCTRGSIGTVAALGLGPIAVAPAAQRQGVGSALMHSMLGAAEGRGEPLVALLGNPEFYSKFGFVASTEHGIEPPEPEWGPLFQVRPLSGFDPATSGLFEYAEPFYQMDD